jgi:hypothetical protein
MIMPGQKTQEPPKNVELPKSGPGSVVVTEKPLVQEQVAAKKEKYHPYDLIVGLRLRSSDEKFPGFWELTELSDPLECVEVKKVLSDANTKGMCAGIASRRFIQYTKIIKTDIPKPEDKK